MVKEEYVAVAAAVSLFLGFVTGTAIVVRSSAKKTKELKQEIKTLQKALGTES
jgi:hypothetical protein